MKKPVKSPAAHTGTARKAVLARQILNYLEKHPDATDTLEGIATWWLQHQCLEQQVEEVAGALEFLVKKGSLIAHQTPAGTTIFKIKKNNEAMGNS